MLCEYGVLMTYCALKEQCGTFCTLRFCHCVSADVTAGYLHFKLETAEKELRGGGGVGCSHSRCKDSNLVTRPNQATLHQHRFADTPRTTG
jgi:hypothetical protein